MGVLRVEGPEAGPRVRAAAGLGGASHEDRGRQGEPQATFERLLVGAAALDLSVHLAQHLVDGLVDPRWFFALGAVGAVGLWVTFALWSRGGEKARTTVLGVLGAGLVWGGLGMHLADGIDDGLTATHATGIVAGLLGAAMLALVAVRLVLRIER